MLRIIPNTDSGHAKNYFSTADYYTEGQELAGRWRGESARRLGLTGEIKQPDWDALCDNRNPATHEQLTVRRKNDRIVGYDFNFHVPKSVSLLYAMSRDERLLDAFRDAVDGTMHAIEEEMATRVRRGGKNENRTSGNMAWGEFIHFTSRPVGGIPDPHLHAHCFVHNLTFDEKEDRWKAGKFRELKRDAPYFEAVFHCRLSHRLGELGLPIERTRKGWELGTVDAGLIDKFSRRKKQIEDKARELGIESAKAKDQLGAKTRESKAKNLTFQQLQETWRSQMTPQEVDALSALAWRVGGDAEPVDSGAAGRAVAHATKHIFERKSVVPERQLLAVAIKHAVGHATVEEVEREAATSELIIGTRDGRRMATTREVLAEEKRMVEFAQKGRGTCVPYASQYEHFERAWLNDSQKQAVRHILGSRDRVILMRGAAGVGKTSLMQEAVEAVETRRTKVFAFAPSADASRTTLRDAGFKDADTVAMLLKNQKLQQQIRGQLVWVDEAGLLDMQTTSQLFALVEQQEARLLLSGDRRQHGSVGRGATLQLLEKEAGLVPAEVKEIQRQKGAYKAAIKALSEGRVEAGFKGLDKLGWIKELPQEDRYKQLAADYVDSVAAGKTALVVSPTHAEGDRITTEIRNMLHDKGILGREERSFRVLQNAHLTEAEREDAVNYASGDVLVFHQNARGFTRGDRIELSGTQALPLDRSKRFQVFHGATLDLSPGEIIRITHNGASADGEHRLDNGSLYRVKGFDEDGNIVLQNGWLIGKDFGHLAHGYVVTSHASQGKTVDRVFVGQGSESLPASSREQFYVSASRARDRVTVYTDSKADLLDAVSRVEERITATEFVHTLPGQQAAALFDRDLELQRQQQLDELRASNERTYSR